MKSILYTLYIIVFCLFKKKKIRMKCYIHQNISYLPKLLHTKIIWINLKNSIYECWTWIDRLYVFSVCSKASQKMYFSFLLWNKIIFITGINTYLNNKHLEKHVYIQHTQMVSYVDQQVNNWKTSVLPFYQCLFCSLPL